MHAPVLLDETIASLDLHEGDFAIDGTLGGGGHAKAILMHLGRSGRLLGVDRDERAIARAQRTLGEPRNATFVHGSYAELPDILTRLNFPKADALLLDLGFSSDQIEESGRGFSFQRDEPLDMRYDVRGGETAAELIARSSAAELARMLREYGEERYADRIAGAIVAARRRMPITTSGMLAAVIADAVPVRGKIHPATKTFMALRIAVNRELEHLKKLIPSLRRVVKPGGRVATITFHSVEDRAVKEGFRALAKEGAAELLTKHVIKPSRAEILANPRSRSAKLRVLKII